MMLALLLCVGPSDTWGRPWLVGKAIFEVPYGAGGGLEVFAHDQVSVGADVNFSPAGVFYRVSLHYWPPFRAGQTVHQFLFGAGGDASMTTGSLGTAVVIMPASVDVRYLVRPIEAVGFVLGVRPGIGFAVPMPHFAFSVVTYAGVAFGAR